MTSVLASKLVAHVDYLKRVMETLGVRSEARTDHSVIIQSLANKPFQQKLKIDTFGIAQLLQNAAVASVMRDQILGPLGHHTLSDVGLTDVCQKKIADIRAGRSIRKSSSILPFEGKFRNRGIDGYA